MTFRDASHGMTNNYKKQFKKAGICTKNYQWLHHLTFIYMIYICICIIYIYIYIYSIYTYNSNCSKIEEQVQFANLGIGVNFSVWFSLIAIHECRISGFRNMIFDQKSRG